MCSKYALHCLDFMSGLYFSSFLFFACILYSIVISPKYKEEEEEEEELYQRIKFYKYGAKVQLKRWLKRPSMSSFSYMTFFNDSSDLFK